MSFKWLSTRSWFANNTDQADYMMLMGYKQGVALWLKAEERVECAEQAIRLVSKSTEIRRHTAHLRPKSGVS